MVVTRWCRGEIAPGTWRWLCRALVVQFLGMLVMSWIVRSPEIHRATPFYHYVSILGVGRMGGNAGAWVFSACFWLFAILLVPWHTHIIRVVREANRGAAGVLIPLAVMGVVGAALVGTFDPGQMGPIPRKFTLVMHGIGAACAFSGHVFVAFLSWAVFALEYRSAAAERRQEMPHPGKLLVPVVILALTVVGVAFSGFAELAAGGRAFTEAGGWSPAAQLFLGLPFWEWSLTLALMFWLFGMSLWWPDPLVRTSSEQASSLQVQSVQERNPSPQLS
ncbi:MAG TPA: hypothetical protein PKL84_00355 [Candidatus Hydrogenedentes bacterium]|nr:hypothetical protein [Candidatus Hydrogenedentota bacterium]